MKNVYKLTPMLRLNIENIIFNIKILNYEMHNPAYI